jgi:hypothetical protein
LPAGNEDKIREVEFDIEDIDAAVRAALCCWCLWYFALSMAEWGL